jgi:hypothetical protein
MFQNQIVHYPLVYETSLAFRWLEDLEEMKMENCHLLTTTLLTRGPWEKINFCHGKLQQDSSSWAEISFSLNFSSQPPTPKK